MDLWPSSRKFHSNLLRISIHPTEVCKICKNKNCICENTRTPRSHAPPPAPHPTTQACAPRDARWFCDFVTDPLWDDIPSVSWLIDPSHRPPDSMPSKKRETKHKPYHLMIDEKTDKETIWLMKTNVTILTHLMVADDLWKTATQTKKWKHEKKLPKHYFMRSKMI